MSRAINLENIFSKKPRRHIQTINQKLKLSGKKPWSSLATIHYMPQLTESVTKRQSLLLSYTDLPRKENNETI